MLQQNTRESAMRREEFHRVLRDWLDESFDDVAGDADSHAGNAWLWVRHGGEHYYLDACSDRAGIREYLREVDASRGNPLWATADDASDVRERIVVGPRRRLIDGFTFYRHVPER